jgi:hypothetical protein
MSLLIVIAIVCVGTFSVGVVKARTLWHASGDAGTFNHFLVNIPIGSVPVRMLGAGGIGLVTVAVVAVAIGIYSGRAGGESIHSTDVSRVTTTDKPGSLLPASPYQSIRYAYCAGYVPSAAIRMVGLSNRGQLAELSESQKTLFIQDASKIGHALSVLTVQAERSEGRAKESAGSESNAAMIAGDKQANADADLYSVASQALGEDSYLFRRHEQCKKVALAGYGG